jgi:hypothetical protein
VPHVISHSLAIWCHSLCRHTILPPNQSLLGTFSPWPKNRCDKRPFFSWRPWTKLGFVSKLCFIVMCTTFVKLLICYMPAQNSGRERPHLCVQNSCKYVNSVLTRYMQVLFYLVSLSWQFCMSICSHSRLGSSRSEKGTTEKPGYWAHSGGNRDWTEYRMETSPTTAPHKKATGPRWIPLMWGMAPNASVQCQGPIWKDDHWCSRALPTERLR